MFIGNLCNDAENKNLDFSELALLYSIAKVFNSAQSKKISMIDVAEHTFVLYLKSIRNHPFDETNFDKIYDIVENLVSKVELSMTQPKEVYPLKDFFFRLSKHHAYVNTIYKIRKHLETKTVISLESKLKLNLINRIDINQMISIETQLIENFDFECFKRIMSIKWKSHTESNLNQEKLEVKSDFRTSNEKKVPPEYQLSKNKTMATSKLFELFERFLKEKNYRFEDANLNQFYFYLKEKYISQNYNRNTLFDFIRTYYTPNYQVKVENKVNRETNLYVYFKPLDDLNAKLGFNLTELIHESDFTTVPHLIHYNEHEINLTRHLNSNELFFLDYFKGIDYTDSSEVDRYNQYLTNKSVMNQFDSYLNQLNNKLKSVSSDYTKDQIKRFVKNFSKQKLFEALNGNADWLAQNTYSHSPYILVEFVELLELLQKDLNTTLNDLLYFKIKISNIKIFNERFYKKTLEKIGNKYGFTRERARQIQKSVADKLKKNERKPNLKIANSLILTYFKNHNYITLSELESVILDYTPVFIELNQNHTENFEYDAKNQFITFNALIITRIRNYISSLPRFFTKIKHEEVIEDFERHFKDVNQDVFDALLKEKYFQGNDYYFDQVQFKNKSDRVKFVLREHFQEGIKVFDDDSISHFVHTYNNYFKTNDFLNQSTRTVGSYITRYTKVISKGTYALVKRDEVITESMIRYIESLIENHRLIYLETLLEKFLENFNEVSIKSIEEFSRLIKLKIKYPSNRFYYAVSEELLNYREHLLEFMTEHPRVYSIKELQNIFEGLNSKTIMNVFNQSDLIIANFNQRYIHVKHSGLDGQELAEIRNKINEKLDMRPFIHILDLFEAIQFGSEISMNENVLSNSLGLFNVVKFYFESDFNFHRPMIAKKETYIGPFKNMLDHYIFNKDIVLIQEIKDFYGYYQKILSIPDIIDDYHPNYYLVNSKEFIRKDVLGITESVAKTVEEILRRYMEINPYEGIEDFDGWHLLPTIRWPWTIQLIYSLSKEYFKNINYSFSNKSYNNMKFRIDWSCK